MTRAALPGRRKDQFRFFFLTRSCNIYFSRSLFYPNTPTSNEIFGLRAGYSHPSRQWTRSCIIGQDAERIDASTDARVRMSMFPQIEKKTPLFLPSVDCERRPPHIGRSLTTASPRSNSLDDGTSFSQSSQPCSYAKCFFSFPRDIT